MCCLVSPRSSCLPISVILGPVDFWLPPPISCYTWSCSFLMCCLVSPSSSCLIASSCSSSACRLNTTWSLWAHCPTVPRYNRKTSGGNEILHGKFFCSFKLLNYFRIYCYDYIILKLHVSAIDRSSPPRSHGNENSYGYSCQPPSQPPAHQWYYSVTVNLKMYVGEWVERHIYQSTPWRN